ncbi:MAG: DNA polymerase I [Candidatus Cloacimonetes bacterium]|nr:DNA polymerase I [Candidatus Cloacimonadota bacterium]
MEKEKLYLIDGTALLYRAYFAFIKNPLINSKGQHTSAIFGTINSFLRLLEVTKARNLVISFDRKEATFRKEISADYKANRPPMPDDLISQVKPVQEFFSMIGMDEISLAGFEADDVLCTLAESYRDKYDIVLVTGDKDYAQMVQDGVVVFDPKKEEYIDREMVINKYGITPEQFIDYLALMGDASDNIPGVKGIGPKGASALLQEYGDLDNIYAHLDEIKGSTQDKLRENKENAYLSQKLAKIDLHVPVAVHESDFLFKPENYTLVENFLDEYELKSLKKRLVSLYDEVIQTQSETNETNTNFSFEAILINTPDSFKELLKSMEKFPVVAFDTETDNIDSHLAKLVGVSLAFEDKKAYYLPFNHMNSENLSLDEHLPQLANALKRKLLVGHNIKYDLHIMHYAGFDLSNPIFDTMIAAYILDAGQQRYSLDSCAEKELNYTMTPISDLIGKGKEQLTFDRVPLNIACKYSAEDAYVSLALYELYKQRLENSNLTDLFNKIEIPLIQCLLKMEQNGVFVDTEILDSLSEKITKRTDELEDEVYTIAGYEFNLNSTQQLGKLLFDEMGIPVVKKTKTGYSTDTSVLEELAPNHKIAELLMEYRQLAKLQSTYILALPKLINPQTRRIHSSFNQTIASTGRLSSTNPNLQNIPIRTELGREIRTAFYAQEANCKIVSADYSQIELRLLAILSKDAEMIKAFNEKIDIHRRTASLIFDVPEELVTKEQRSQAKTINFGIIYGMGSVKLSQTLNISRKDATKFIENYFKTFPTIKDWMEKAKQFAHQNEYCETMWGRRLYLPWINKGGKSEADSERVAINMPIQGSAADVIKIAMINIHNKIKKNKDIRMIIQVHDELVFEVDFYYLDEAIKLIREEMENALPEAYKGIVPLTVDIGVGDNWFEAH